MSKALRLNQLSIKMCFTVAVTNFIHCKEVVLIQDIEITDYFDRRNDSRKFSKYLDRSTDNQGFARKTNSLDKNCEISKCNVCGLIYHWTKQCPDSYENKTKPQYESQITLLGECMDTLIGETLSMAVIDSGCTKTVCGQV